MVVIHRRKPMVPADRGLDRVRQVGGEWRRVPHRDRRSSIAIGSTGSWPRRDDSSRWVEREPEREPTPRARDRAGSASTAGRLTALPSATMSAVRPSTGPLAGTPRHRLLDGPGRAVLHDAPRRPRRRRHQGRAPRGRRDPRLGSAVGRAMRPPGRGPRRTSSRSTATSAASGSTCKHRRRAPPSCAGCSRTRTSSSRTSGPAALPASASTTRRCAHQPATSSTWRSPATAPTGPAAGRPGYDFVIQAVGGLMSITGEADDDGGGPTKVGVAISDVVTGLFAAIGILAALLGRGRRRPARPGQRVDVSLLGSTLASPRQPGPERVRHGPRARPARQRPSRTSSRTRRSRRPMARSRSRSGRSGSGRASARRSGSRARRRSALRHERRPGRAPRRAPAAARGAVRDAPDRRLARRRSRRPRSRAGRSTTSLAAFASPGGRGARDDGRGRASAFGA